MKKIAMFIAAAAVAASASAQRTVVTGSKASDNIYVGVNAGATTALKGENAFSAFDPALGVRVGKNFTTVFGMALDLNAQIGAHSGDCSANVSKTFFNGVSANLLGTANLSNLFAGYKGEPRCFEVIALGGFGWGHAFPSDYDVVNTKLALDFAYNFGEQKQWQAYIEPSINFATAAAVNDFKYNVNDATMSLRAGVNYKFGCSNGKHNMAIEQLRDQAEIDGLNAKINALRADLDAANAKAKAKDAQTTELQKALKECQEKPAQVVESGVEFQPSVIFSQGKSYVNKSQLANISLVAKYMKENPESKVKISGYASPEGPKNFNQKLSERRAAAVKKVLVNKYKIAADRIETEGCGTTDKLYDEVKFNRVAVLDVQK